MAEFIISSTDCSTNVIADGTYEVILASNDEKYGGANRLIGKLLTTKKGKLVFDLPSNTGLYLRKVEE